MMHKIAELAARLPSGRVHANGKGFIPAVRRDLYSKLLEASGQPPEPQPAARMRNADRAARRQGYRQATHELARHCCRPCCDYSGG